jgi:hypothetical protein
VFDDPQAMPEVEPLRRHDPDRLADAARATIRCSGAAISLSTRKSAAGKAVGPGAFAHRDLCAAHLLTYCWKDTV